MGRSVFSTATSHPNNGVLFPGLNGANPLGFLAALGTLQILTDANQPKPIAMSWVRTPQGYRPSMHGADDSLTVIARQIAGHLKCPFQTTEALEADAACASRRFDQAMKRLRESQDEVKRLRLKPKEEPAQEAILGPLRAEVDALREAWLTALANCVPFPELSLGKHINATRARFREATSQAAIKSDIRHRDTADVLASFGSDACCIKKRDQIQASPFCFITGSGHQYFLDTVRQLAGRVDDSRIERALADDGVANDERLSMRWDPLEDRRYALMWSDPTDSGNTAKTNWARNLLAYRGLGLAPAIPTKRGLSAVGWSSGREPHWTWPIWHGAHSAAVVRSLLASPFLARGGFDARELFGLGVCAVYRSTRIEVGHPPLHKVNFTPAHRIV